LNGRRRGGAVKARKPIIGLAGGIASGKTLVASIFGQLGAGVISSDELNHAELNSPDVLRKLGEWWPNSAVDHSGRVNREALREIVQRDPAARRRIESLTHPRIAARRRKMMAEFQADERVGAIVWDSPLLFEAGLAEACDFIVFVEADKHKRLARAKEERGWTQQDLERFEKLQKPLDFKRRCADYIVDNNSDTDVVRSQVADVYSRILTAAKASCG